MSVGTNVGEAQGLRKYRLFESSDVDDTRERIARVMQPHSLQPVGSPAGSTNRGTHPRADDANAKSHMDFISFSGVGIGTISYGEAMRVDVPSIAGYYLVMFCREGNAQTHVDREPLAVGGARGIVCGPNRPFSALFSANSEQLVLRIGQEAMRAHTGIERLVFNRDLDMRRLELQAWLWQLQALTTSTALVDAAQRNAKVAVELEGLLIHLLMSGQSWVDGGGWERGHSATSACVRKAEAFIEDNAHDLIRLQQIADAAGVPVRTLLDGFKRFRNCSPIQYLREVRLERARHQLLDPRSEAGIAALALDCGFAHLGRFSSTYRERFGETPSETLKRVRGYEPSVP